MRLSEYIAKLQDKAKELEGDPILLSGEQEVVGVFLRRSSAKVAGYGQVVVEVGYRLEGDPSVVAIRPEGYQGRL